MASANVTTETITTTTVTLTLTGREAEELRGVLAYVAMFGEAGIDPGAVHVRNVYEALDSAGISGRYWEIVPRGNRDGYHLSSRRRQVEKDDQ